MTGFYVAAGVVVWIVIGQVCAYRVRMHFVRTCELCAREALGERSLHRNDADHDDARIAAAILAIALPPAVALMWLIIALRRWFDKNDRTRRVAERTLALRELEREHNKIASEL